MNSQITADKYQLGATVMLWFPVTYLMTI